jgi:hypothetical protein
MAKIELAEETRRQIEELPPVDILVGITAPGSAEEVWRKATDTARALSAENGAPQIALAYPRTEGSSDEIAAVAEKSTLRVLHYDLPQVSASSVPWVETSSAVATLMSMALEIRAGACVVLSPDATSLNVQSVRALTMPVLEKQHDLVMPVYSIGKYEALLNNSILSPLTRALYGKRIQFPLPPEFGVSPRMYDMLSSVAGGSFGAGRDQNIIWPATRAALAESQICEVKLDVHHTPQTDGLDLSTVLAHLVGSLFSEMETTAMQWQRVRGSQAVPLLGGAAPEHAGGEAVDPRPMLDSFQLGSRNLQEVWSLVLPPVTLLELKRLTRLPPEKFRLPDELWVRIIYDFALAHRLRTISRTHLLGALTPLYLGFVASYVQEVGGASDALAKQVWERLAKAYEDGKSYLVSRWRWPDRFNP